MKTLLTILFVIVAAGAVIFGITAYLEPNSLVNCPAQPNGQGNCQKADAIIALSGGDTAARTQAAIDRYKNGWADVLIFSGAAQDKSGPSNALVMERQAEQEGVPASAILLDEASVDTAQNASDTATIFATKNIHSAILVTSGYHQRRAYLEFEKIAKGVTILNAPTDDSDWNMWWWLRTRGWWLAGGEIAKIIIFYITGANV